MTFWRGVLWLHLLAMAFFVGGQLMLAAIVVPVLRGSAQESLRAAARRFGYGTLVAVGVLIVTGIAMASHLHRWDSSALQVKLGLVVVVALLIAGICAGQPFMHSTARFFYSRWRSYGWAWSWPARSGSRAPSLR